MGYNPMGMLTSKLEDQFSVLTSKLDRIAELLEKIAENQEQGFIFVKHSLADSQKEE